MSRLAAFGRATAATGRRVSAFVRRRSIDFGELWRQSLQFRVTISTLALSSAVVFVLGMVLQNQITDRLIETKKVAAIAQTRAILDSAESELSGIDAATDQLKSRLDNVLRKLTSVPAGQDPTSASAGAFEPVLASVDPSKSSDTLVSSGPFDKVTPRLRQFVEGEQFSEQIHTAGVENARTTYLMIGAPITGAPRPLQLYLLFPLTAEQNTVSTVQNTLLVGGLVLLFLLVLITNLVTRQVVHPVRRAAAAAERFADGDLDQRLGVLGEDDLAKLAESYNEMAASIQRQIRQLEEFGQLQRRFTSDVSHELRTPLTTVRMAADVLHASREQFPPGLARSTELLVDELDRFEALLGDLLEISRLDAGVEELSAELIDARPIVLRVVEQVRVIAGEADSLLDVELPDTPVEAELDSRRVERILRNLLANAVDHSEGKPVRVRLATNEHALAITVQDFGVGLRTGEAGLVFNRFWRADPSRNRRTGGTGLGLAISHEDAKLHGGELEAWGEPDRGACFRLTLPLRQGEEWEDSPLDLPPDVPPGGFIGIEPDEPAGEVSVTPDLVAAEREEAR
ncbi:MtrAB system histidine kinase MtrB [Amycolatopsis sp. 195334CR]|uniref:MtrAB system histidine kinase MtrB n=1 Tax=Amycolatopsis sp. 195334CR TaxID=2814588 RepID=UPI001A8DFB4A|nr:MtrAB system histidine kinase MtrB [Amycolatopsis sp. 195334CR]MBN6034504.1 HAMP domain-containing histidine kinase [Amycolatopsis sp. 195334CR]